MSLSKLIDSGNVFELQARALTSFLNGKVSNEELVKRKAEMPIKKKEVSGYLKRYSRLVSSADKGAILK